MLAKKSSNLKVILVLLLMVAAGINSFAGKRYWVGTGANKNWNSTGNWSTTSGGGSGSSVPGSTDSVYFDTLGPGQCSINATVNIKRLEIKSTYHDTVKQNANAITIGTSGMILSGGVFQGGSAAITNSGIFTLSGTNFISTSNILSIAGNYTFSSGTFTHNSGEVKFTATCSINGNTTFYKLTFAPAGTSTFTISSSIILTVLNELKTSGSAAININTGDIVAKGDIVISNTSVTSSTGGTATITIYDTSNQTFTGTSAIGRGKLCNIKINKTGGTLTFKDYISVDANWQYIQGTLDATSYTNEIVFYNNNGNHTISGTHTLKYVDLNWSASNDYIIRATDTLTVTGTFKTLGSGLGIVDSGTVNIKGDIETNHTTAAYASGGDASIHICGTGSQTFIGSSTILTGKILANIKINKPSGTLTLKNYVNVGEDWIYVQGTIDASTNNSTVVFPRNANRTISGAHTLYNVAFHNTSTSDNTLTDTLTVDGLLSFQGGNSAVITTGTIDAKGDITTTATNVSAGGTGFIRICGTGNQTFTGTTIGVGGFEDVKVDKPSGTLIMKNTISILGDWRYVQGTIDATTYNSTLAMTTTNNRIYGSHSLNNLSIYAGGSGSTTTLPSTDTVSVLGTLKYEGSNAAIFNTGTIKALGDITITNTNSSSGGTGLIKICGTGNQTLTGSGIAGSGGLCDIEVNKPSDTLYLSSIISLEANNWNYIKGTVSPGTSAVVMDGNGNTSCGTSLSTGMPFYDFRVMTGTTTLTGTLKMNRNLTIDASRTLNGNSKAISVGGDWTNTGTFTYANTDVTLNGSGRQHLIKSSGNINFHNLIINKSTQKVLLSAPTIVNNALTLTKGAIGTTSTNLLSMPDNATTSGGSDSSFVCGPFKKTGNDAFIFPLGDTTLSDGAHPIGISAPSSTTDAFLAQYFSANQAFGDSLQTDSLESISNCEYWNLRRTAGSSSVTPTLAWNSNSCNVNSYDDLRVAYMDTTTTPDRWKSLGNAGVTVTGKRGTVLAGSPVSLTIAHLTLGRYKFPSNRYTELKRKLDGGYHHVINGNLLFKYDEEYADTDGKLKFNIYDEENDIVASNTTMPSGIQPVVSYGDNRYSLNVLDCAFGGTERLTAGKMFLLEVINEKNEKWYLRFKNSSSLTLTSCH